MQTVVFDSARAETFSERLLDTLNRGALCLMISVGHRTGLFDTFARLGWVTSGELAKAAGLDERYVREWLGAMTVGGVISADDDNHFFLPPEHSAFLTRAARADNMSVFAQYIGQLGSVEDDIVGCFRNGGGVPYERFTRFHEIMAEDSGQSVLPALDTHILELVPGLREKLEAGIRVLDAGCGRGLAIMRLAERFPNSEFHGVDLSTDAIAYARNQVMDRHLGNVILMTKDLSDFDASAEDEKYDLVFTFDAVHDQAKPLNLLTGIRRTLKRDGVYVMQDIHGHSHVQGNLDNPLAPLLYTVSCMHCMTVSLAQGGEGLGAMWGREKAQEMLREAGFAHIDIRRLDHDIQNDWYVIRK
ncbi:MAG: methyltransferase domain-containing protein [Proteobacteria bacterium]|nr:methyltransferase domain-containing protein [Pseudomonadota bacterium]